MKSSNNVIVIPELEKKALEYKPRAKRWTEEEMQILRSYYGRVHISDIAEIIGRPRTAVKQKAEYMGLKLE